MTQTIYEMAGGRQAFLDLAHAWHARCLADPIVGHAFSHGFHPQHSERLYAAYWAEAAPADHPTTPQRWAMSRLWFECTRETASTRRWTSEHKPASRRRSMTQASPMNRV